MVKRTTEERFWHRVRFAGDEAGGCWIWGGAMSSTGYGNFYGDGRYVHPHRYAYELLAGPVPDGMVLDHLCRVRACCNPKHLEPVTRAENLRRGLLGVLRESCDAGHPLNQANTRIRGTRRECRVCVRLRKRKQRGFQGRDYSTRMAS